jgi:hypothetical protein
VLRALTLALAVAPFRGFEYCEQAAPPTSWTQVDADLVKCDSTQPNSGAFSLALSNPSSQLARAQSNCIVVPPNTFIPTFALAYRTGAADVVQVGVTVIAYPATDCSGSGGAISLGAGFSFGPLFTDNAWHTLSGTALLDSTIHSIRLTASFQVNTAGASSVVHFDDIHFADASATTTSTTLLPGSSSTSTTTSTPGATTTITIAPVSFPGTGSAASECYATFEGIASGRVDCTDGDSACDADAASGTCTFAFRVCVAEALAGCQGPTVTSLKATPKKLAIPLPAVPASTPACGAPAQVVVPLRRHGRRPGKVTVVFVAKHDSKPKRERDVLRFRCLPPA